MVREIIFQVREFEAFPTSARRYTKRIRRSVITLVLEAARSTHDLWNPSDKSRVFLGQMAKICVTAAPPPTVVTTNVWRTRSR